MTNDYILNKTGNKIWINHIYNHQLCSKNFGHKSHLIDLILYLKGNDNLLASGGDRVVKANL